MSAAQPSTVTHQPVRAATAAFIGTAVEFYDYYTYATYNGIQLLGAAVAKAGSSDPAKVAKALEGLSVKSFAGDVTMRERRLLAGNEWGAVPDRAVGVMFNEGRAFPCSVRVS